MASPSRSRISSWRRLPIWKTAVVALSTTHSQRPSTPCHQGVSSAWMTPEARTSSSRSSTIGSQATPTGSGRGCPPPAPRQTKSRGTHGCVGGIDGAKAVIKAANDGPTRLRSVNSKCRLRSPWNESTPMPGLSPGRTRTASPRSGAARSRSGCRCRCAPTPEPRTPPPCGRPRPTSRTLGRNGRRPPASGSRYVPSSAARPATCPWLRAACRACGQTTAAPSRPAAWHLRWDHRPCGRRRCPSHCPRRQRADRTRAVAN